SPIIGVPASSLSSLRYRTVPSVTAFSLRLSMILIAMAATDASPQCFRILFLRDSILLPLSVAAWHLHIINSFLSTLVSFYISIAVRVSNQGVMQPLCGKGESWPSEQQSHNVTGASNSTFVPSLAFLRG